MVTILVENIFFPILLLSLSYPKVIKHFAATANHSCLLLTREALLLELEHHGMLEAMPLLGCSRAQSRLELFHAPVTQSRASTVHQELADLARPEGGKGMLSSIVSLPPRRAVPTPFLYPSTHSSWMFLSGICTHCFGAQEKERYPLPFRTQANIPVPLCHQFL